jgi:hypothetical protein
MKKTINIDDKDRFILKFSDLEAFDNLLEDHNITYEVLLSIIERIKKCKDNTFEFILDGTWYQLNLKELKYEKIQNISEEDEIKDCTLEGTD